ncbi:TetR/AcrR family transcriptional regulator [Paenibacillus sp. CAA11]|uniref:TetR/AcrR family transcriptional regulator n=1 Tax=Paenibacillus sp. CAA11 TaxID=1532905 RepID=UPI000D34C7B9|nr:TetR/AcrR family transcriptional regulator [Paenibacillus sp. CAA11]AWB46297.1 TetR/AcrR family transcriptional regulator [Paenibacillus sp. CAA11]
MADKATDRRKLILRTAMQLFAAKGASATSMQEIAELCGMSKGSLYLHFKSKEELEQSIYNYCYQMLEDRLAQVEQQKDSSPRDKLRIQIRVLLEQVLELREFLMMQLRDWLGSGKMPVEPGCVRENNLRLLHWGGAKLEIIYGAGIKPYIGELLFILNGMLGSYIRLLFMPNLPVSTEQMAKHLLTMLDESAAFMLRSKAAPLIPLSFLEAWGQHGPRLDAQPNRHPLFVIRQMKDELNVADADPELREEAAESLRILENELIELQPRKALLLGMLRNLRTIPALEERCNELETLIRLYR